MDKKLVLLIYIILCMGLAVLSTLYYKIFIIPIVSAILVGFSVSYIMDIINNN